MAGLDVAHKAQILAADIERFRAIGNPVSTIVAEHQHGLLYGVPQRTSGLSAHRCTFPCTIAGCSESPGTVDVRLNVETEIHPGDDGGGVFPDGE